MVFAFLLLYVCVCFLAIFILKYETISKFTFFVSNVVQLQAIFFAVAAFFCLHTYLHKK